MSSKRELHSVQEDQILADLLRFYPIEDRQKGGSPVTLVETSSLQQHNEQNEYKASLKEEYRDVSENIRHRQNMRFAQLTVFFVITAALLNVIFENSGSLTNISALTIKSLFGNPFFLVYFSLIIIPIH